MAGGSAILEAERLSVSFSSQARSIEVLDDFSLELARGTWTTCLGPSGCGKTTLLRVLAGLIEPDRGSIRIAPEFAGLSQIAYLPQQDTLLPWRTALRNAILGSEIEKRPRVGALRQAHDLFARFELEGAESQYPHQLSGGMRQRVAVIRTYLTGREILLLDEPLGALDPLTRTDLQEWLLDVWGELGKTVLLVTHDVEEALLLSDFVSIMTPRPARIRWTVEPELPRPRSRTTSGFVEQKETILRLLRGDES